MKKAFSILLFCSLFVRPLTTETLRPNADGVYYPPTDEWTPVGSATCFGAVNESSADDDSKYIETGEFNHYATFTLPANSIPGGATISQVQVFARAKYIPGTSQVSNNILLIVISGGSDFAGSSQTMTTSYADYSEIWLTDPSGGAWTISDITNLEIGVYSNLNSGDNSSMARVTQLYCVVTYTAAAGTVKKFFFKP